MSEQNAALQCAERTREHRVKNSLEAIDPLAKVKTPEEKMRRQQTTVILTFR